MITLSASGGSVTFTFSGNSTYLNDGQITVPVNSLALIIDESDMATFRKSASNDIFVSANIAEFGMTKAELESWYKANMVGSTGGGGGVTSGEVQTMIDESISGKVDTDTYSTYTANTNAAIYGLDNKMNDIEPKVNSAWTKGVRDLLWYPTSSGLTLEYNIMSGGTYQFAVQPMDESLRYGENAGGVNRYLGVYASGSTYTVGENQYVTGRWRDTLPISNALKTKKVVIQLNQSYTGSTPTSNAIQALYYDNNGVPYNPKWNYNSGTDSFTISTEYTGITLTYDQVGKTITLELDSSYVYIGQIRTAKNIAPADDLTNPSYYIGVVTIETNSYKLQDALDNKQDTLIAGEGINISGDVISVTGGSIDSGAVESMIEGYMTDTYGEPVDGANFQLNSTYGFTNIFQVPSMTRNYLILNVDMMNPNMYIIPTNNQSDLTKNLYTSNSQYTQALKSKYNLQNAQWYDGQLCLLIDAANAATIPSFYKDDSKKVWLKLNQYITKGTFASDVISGWNDNAIYNNLVGWSEVSGNSVYCLATLVNGVGVEMASYGTEHPFDGSSISMGGNQYVITLDGVSHESYMNVYGEYVALTTVQDMMSGAKCIFFPLANDKYSYLTNNALTTHYIDENEVTVTYDAEDLTTFSNGVATANSALTVGNSALATANSALTVGNSALTKANAAAVQSDWNNNDSGSTNYAYIKNRPFYSEEVGTDTFLADCFGDSWYQISYNGISVSNGIPTGTSLDIKFIDAATNITYSIAEIAKEAGWTYQPMTYNGWNRETYWSKNGIKMFTIKATSTGDYDQTMYELGEYILPEPYNSMTLKNSYPDVTKLYKVEYSENVHPIDAKYVQLKTINNIDIHGTGNIDIQGGGSSYTAGEGIDITNDVISVTGKADSSAVTEVSDVLTAHTANTTVHVTSTEKNTWNAKSDFSGSYNDLTDKPTSNTAFTNDAGYITSGEAQTQIDNSISGKQDTLSAGTNITIVDNVISATGGGGGSYTAGRGIDITNSEISVSLPISAGTGDYSIIEGRNTEASGNYSHAEGINTKAEGNCSHAEGDSSIASGHFSHAEGRLTSAITYYSHAEGNCTKTSNDYEHASGRYNNSVSATTTFGDSGNTLFSVGNGTSDSARHNTFEIRQNGDIYFFDGTNDVKLQDVISNILNRLTTIENNS